MPILAWKDIIPAPLSQESTPFRSVNSISSTIGSRNSPNISPLLLPPPLNTSKKTTTRKKLLRTFSRTVKSSPKLAALMGRLCNGDSGTCLTFGQYVKPTKKLFNNFTNFEYAQPNMHPIGSPSANGFVYEIAYEHHGLRAHTILKCSSPPPSSEYDIDSLYYEYLVGHWFVNQCNQQFPCFLETYGAYHMTDPRLVHTLATLAKNKRDYPITNVESSIKRFKAVHRTEDAAQQMRISCEQQFNLCILIQHIRASYSMKSHFDLRYQDKNYYYYELPQLLYQVYAPLALLGDTFTHYDLHRDNVLLFNLGATQYIEMRYVYPSEPEDIIVSFKTHLICKIIDYGRSYFYANRNINSETVRTQVCKECIDRKHPENTCGSYNGYSWLDPSVSPSELKERFYVMSSRANTSHDLRLMNEFKRDAKRPKDLPCWMTEIFNNLYYEDKYGTPEHTSSSSPSDSNVIYNVTDATIQLGHMLLDPGFVAANNKFYGHATSVGTLTIYMDSSRKSMKFDPIPFNLI